MSNVVPFVTRAEKAAQRDRQRAVIAGAIIQLEGMLWPFLEMRRAAADAKTGAYVQAVIFEAYKAVHLSLLDLEHHLHETREGEA